MTRGRKKDLTIPPTRALVQQRDYRARRAQYVADLEQRVRLAEEENAHLRTELTAARASQGSQGPPGIPYTPQLAQASAELLHTLSAASTSLARFQQLAIPDQSLTLPALGGQGLQSPASSRLSERQLPPLGPLPNTLRPASFPSPAPSPPFTYGAPSSKVESPQTHHPPRRKRLYREDSPESSSESGSRYAPHDPRTSRSPSLGSECCGGFMDCRELVESSDEHSDEHSEGDHPPRRAR